MTQYGFFIDLSRCIGCNACTVVCKQWHDFAPGPAKPMRVYQWETGTYPDVRLHMFPVMCYHCETPTCLEACENKAIYKEEKYGAVLVDPNKCQGSRKCWEACPYGAPQFEGDERDLKMLKCDMCIDRLEGGLKPICVLSCGMRALEFGPMDEIIEKYGEPNRLGAEPGHAPCRLACPATVDAEGYMTLLSEGKVKEAIELFRKTTPFAGVLGRVCTHPCESACQRGKIDQPVSIRALKRFMADDELREGREKATPVVKTKEARVAIIGSGPAGLSCAYDLIRMGYPVTVFESAPKIGGMLRYGIPEYRLPKNIVDNEICYIEELGVEIRTDAPVKRLEDLFDQGYKAVFVATGAWASQKLDVPGEDARGVSYGLEFLRRVNSGERIEVGGKAAVIGGGSVAIDAARVALRLGAAEVHLVCLESRDLTSRDRMPAQDLEIQDAEEEGIVIHPCLGIRKILTRDRIAVGLETVVCTSVLDARGNFAPKFSEGPVPTITTDTVIVAIGHKPTPNEFTEADRDPSRGLKADELTLETDIKGVFAGADVVTGPGNVINAIAAGKEAAISIDRYLRKVDLKKDRRLPPKSVIEKGVRRSVRPAVIPVEQRRDFAEIEHAFDKKMANEQTSRCVRCGSTMPCVVFKRPDPKVEVIPWDASRALELWQKRQPYDGQPLPDIFPELSDVMQALTDIVGRNKLVLKPKNSAELLYYTMDDE